MKSLRQILKQADKESGAKAMVHLKELLKQFSQKMYSDGTWKMQTLKRKKWS